MQVSLGNEKNFSGNSGLLISQTVLIKINKKEETCPEESVYYLCPIITVTFAYKLHIQNVTTTMGQVV